MSNYNSDFYSWTQEQAALIRAGRLSELDLENLVEEIETMGRSEKTALESRLTVLIVHLLKWQYQPVGRGNNWKYTIDDQRRKFQKVLKDNPGLKAQLDEILSDAYEQALHNASFETGLMESIFTPKLAWTLDQLCESSFYPD